MVTSLSLEGYCTSLSGVFLVYSVCGRKWGKNSVLGRFVVFSSKFVWKSQVPFKVKSFVWLVAHKKHGESADHLFLHCSLTIGLWYRLFQLTKTDWVPPRSIFDMMSIKFNGFGSSKRGIVLWASCEHRPNSGLAVDFLGGSAVILLLLVLCSLIRGEVLPFKSYLHRYATPYMASQAAILFAIHLVGKNFGPSEAKFIWNTYRISNIHYNITNGDRYPIPDKSAPVYITVGDGGNQEGLAGRVLFIREASYGHSTLEIKNRTHAFYHWNRNDDGKKVPTDSVVFYNQYWARNLQRRRLKRNHIRTIERGTATF
ncbi:Bifunctional purple acid phosphatase 26 [Vitis vinifera]|uniref:Bifunctional purple acid phosphatase 26 n=1 Tax=Vitis vinifera TaxID=29760 RepID=A0A438CK11_VITVI|nr:Bifunctional purple acid phosphatase 26 [Vitis vinifera]